MQSKIPMKSVGFVSRLYLDIARCFLKRCENSGDTTPYGFYTTNPNGQSPVGMKEIRLFCKPRQLWQIEEFIRGCFLTYKVHITRPIQHGEIKNGCCLWLFKVNVLGTISPLTLNIYYKATFTPPPVNYIIAGKNLVYPKRHIPLLVTSLKPQRQTFTTQKNEGVLTWNQLCFT